MDLLAEYNRVRSEVLAKIEEFDGVEDRQERRAIRGDRFALKSALSLTDLSVSQVDRFAEQAAEKIKEPGVNDEIKKAILSVNFSSVVVPLTGLEEDVQMEIVRACKDYVTNAFEEKTGFKPEVK